MTTLEPEAKAYRATVRKRVILLTLFLAVTVALFLFNVMIGSSNIPLKEVLAVIFTGEGMGHNPMIVREVRLPMALMAAVIGASLGIGGCEIQTILRNPIASPYTLGITNAAKGMADELEKEMKDALNALTACLNSGVAFVDAPGAALVGKAIEEVGELADKLAEAKRWVLMN